MRNSALTIGVALALLFALGCHKNSAESSKPRLRVGMIPTTDPGKILRESLPLVSYLEEKTDTRVEMFVPTNYAAVVEAIAQNQLDIAYLGGFTFVQTSKRNGVEPLVQRDRDQNFHSVFITQTGSRIHSLNDLKGHTFAFGDVNSTSGHLMPAYYMHQANVDPKVIAKALYTGGHDATALAVANKKVDAGAMDELVFENMTKAGKISPNQVRVFYTTPPFFDYVWVARKGLDARISSAFTEAMLKLDGSNLQDKIVLDLLNATKYVRANNSDYDKLRQAGSDEGLLK